MAMGNIEKYFFIIINIILLIGIITWISSKLLLNNKNCRRLDKYYNKFPTIGSINHSNDNYKDKLLRDFYIIVVLLVIIKMIMLIYVHLKLV